MTGSAVVGGAQMLWAWQGAEGESVALPVGAKLARLLHSFGRSDEAEEVYRTTLAGCRRTLVRPPEPARTRPNPPHAGAAARTRQPNPAPTPLAAAASLCRSHVLCSPHCPAAAPGCSIGRFSFGACSSPAPLACSSSTAAGERLLCAGGALRLWGGYGALRLCCAYGAPMGRCANAAPMGRLWGAAPMLRLWGAYGALRLWGGQLHRMLPFGFVPLLFVRPRTCPRAAITNLLSASWLDFVGRFSDPAAPPNPAGRTHLLRCYPRTWRSCAAARAHGRARSCAT